MPSAVYGEFGTFPGTAEPWRDRWAYGLVNGWVSIWSPRQIKKILVRVVIVKTVYIIAEQGQRGRFFRSEAIGSVTIG
ncbi:MAG: hypothetical protein VYA30_16750 [Myxococcota bacterium]|nr:hypothetical protein [Myxococcota bacterium]